MCDIVRNIIRKINTVLPPDFKTYLSNINNTPLSDDELADIAKTIESKIRYSCTEWVICIDTCGNVLHAEEGDECTVRAPPLPVMRQTRVCIHNHPSKRSPPSDDDIRFLFHINTNITMCVCSHDTYWKFQLNDCGVAYTTIADELSICYEHEYKQGLREMAEKYDVRVEFKLQETERVPVCVPEFIFPQCMAEGVMADIIDKIDNEYDDFLLILRGKLAILFEEFCYRHNILLDWGTYAKKDSKE